MKKALYIIIGVSLLLLTSCGPQADAESLVKDFMEKNIKEGLKPRSLHFTDIDSTHAITDSVVINLRQQAKQGTRYQEDIKYASDEPFHKLIVTRVKYHLDDEECSDTYYLDMALTRVVAFKEN